MSSKASFGQPPMSLAQPGNSASVILGSNDRYRKPVSLPSQSSLSESSIRESEERFLTGRFKEAKDKTVYLEQDRSTTFSFFVHWLYNGHLPSEDKGDDADIVKKFYKHDSPGHGAIVKLYIFGDKYNCPDRRRAAIDLLFIDVTENDFTFPSWREVDLAFENLQPGDPFCRLLVDFMAIYSHEKIVAKEREKYTNVAFLKAVLARFVLGQEMREDLATMGLELCDYHEHMNDEEGKACEKERGHIPMAQG